MLLKTEAVQDAQQSYSTAWWDNDWVLKYGTHPTEMVTDPRTGRKLHRRQMPVPYGSGGSGAVQEQDRTTRIQVTDTKGQELASGAVVKIRIVLEHKDSVLWLPPDAVRSFEGRRFVVVREGDRERRVTVKTGIETEDKIEIVEGVKEGDLIVGQ